MKIPSNRQWMCKHKGTDHQDGSQTEANATGHLSHNDPVLVKEDVSLQRSISLKNWGMSESQKQPPESSYMGGKWW